MKAIPEGNTKEAREARRQIIRQSLNRWKGKTVKCPCLGNVPVLIEQKSIDEISEHAGISLDSTEMALQLPHLIKNARFYRMTLPKNNSLQKKKFQFIFMYELRAESRDGKQAKLTVGIKEIPLMFLQYCVTAVRE